jgi:hypothetical protein
MASEEMFPFVAFCRKNAVRRPLFALFRACWRVKIFQPKGPLPLTFFKKNGGGGGMSATVAAGERAGFVRKTVKREEKSGKIEQKDSFSVKNVNE